MNTSEMNQHEFFEYVFSLPKHTRFTQNQRITIQRFMNDNFEKFCIERINTNGEYGFSFTKVCQYLKYVTPVMLENIEFNYI